MTRTLMSRAKPDAAEKAAPLQYGDIIFAASGETAEEIGLATTYLGDEPAVVGGDTVILTDHGQDPIFLSHALNSETVAKQKAELGKGHSVVHIHAPDLAKLRFWLPTSGEQRRIAAVFDTWDNAITNAEALAELKRTRFVGLMQALINDAETQKEELINFASLAGAKCDVVDGAFDESIELDNVATGSGQLIGRSSSDGLMGQRVRFEVGDTLFAKLRPYLRKSFFAGEPGMASTEMWVLRADEARCLPRYLNYLVRSDLFQAEADRPTGSRMPRADWSWVRETPLPLPGLNEQGRIVSILEVAEADWRLSVDAVLALRRQKRGLMQKLLTGEWRVPAAGDAFIPSGPAADQLEAAE